MLEEGDAEIQGSSLPRMITDLENKINDFNAGGGAEMSLQDGGDPNGWIDWVEQYTYPNVVGQPKIIEKTNEISSSPSATAAKKKKNKKPIKQKQKLFTADKATRAREKKQKELKEFNDKMDSIAFSAAIAFAGDGVSAEEAKKLKYKKSKMQEKNLMF